ncbi:2-C-methyl-D-erythritol 4-phosphate cytidylyltransferase [Salinibacterium soli]|uniref:Bifunctional enzyme IspD/IspF n=1 Tax=Antiquaquibacter soli TaxID=3064523 RepID=A0ABT9BQR0_9MICO|nr:2-C-methyl-D-erythritol 4-phosphate cytidylyltransferase [Protaetiibacter sp. WY-16]MDO7883371.1 2-C-methyl-D-erythritol 4-phosphate cytidylyltransferase [Protaetiibacter sp. WY-16]
MTPHVAVLIVAAGSGTRLGAGVPKAFARFAGATVLEHAVRGAFGVGRLVVVAPPESIDEARAIVEPIDPEAVVVGGGASRQASVAAGLAVLEPGIRIVLVHDAARALTPRQQLEAVASAVAETGAGVIPALPVSDTIKLVDGQTVLDTVDRSRLAAVQTPQGFPREPLDRAYAGATAEYTDDAALFAAAGGIVVTVEGSPLAFKITTAADLARAEQEAGDAVGATIRTGVGMDVHAYDAAEPLWLGGLYWPDEVGLSGHSDGDAMSHAICDALLSAAGLGDIGGKFGTDDPRFAGAHGDVFIRETVALVQGAGFEVGNVAVQLIANGPRLGARRVELEAHLSSLVGAPVSVSATTSDGLGFTGKGEGVAVIATALVTA